MTILSRHTVLLLPLLLLLLQSHINLSSSSSTSISSSSPISSSNYNVRHLSTHFSRVFLSINWEKVATEEGENKLPTLIETEWPVPYLPIRRTIIFPNPDLHSNGNHSDCTKLQQSYWSQVDNFNRLWVLDIGIQSICQPKLLVFDLMRNNVEVMRIDCGEYIGLNNTGLVVHLGPRTNCCDVEQFIYFTLPNSPHIIAYDILAKSWNRRQLLCDKYKSLGYKFPIKPIDFTFGAQQQLLITDKDGVLYSSESPLKWEEEDGNEVKSIQLKRIGSLLGVSSSLMTDYCGTLFYVVPKFGAVVRCPQLSSNLTTEDNEIIYLTSKNIQQIFFGPNGDGAVWVLSDRVLQSQDICYPGVDEMPLKIN